MNTKGKKTRNILAFALIPIILTCFCSMAGAQQKPNLIPSPPPGCSSGASVILKNPSCNQGCGDDSPLYNTDTLYFDWGVTNNGTEPTTTNAGIYIYVDGKLIINNGMAIPPLSVGQTSGCLQAGQGGGAGCLNCPSVTGLCPGTHSIRFVVDSLNTITESNEADNEYTRTITIASNPQPPQAVFIDSITVGGTYYNFWQRGSNIPTNATITIKYNMSMDTTTGFVALRDEYENDIIGTIQWSKTCSDNDTVTFIPNQALRPATHYQVYGQVSSSGNVAAGPYIDFNFFTKLSTADASPPVVQTFYPYSGMTGVSTTAEIYIKFSEMMNPGSINNATITLAGPGISVSSQYNVFYDFVDQVVRVKKNTPFTPSSKYTVTVTPNVKDLRGNWLKEQYQWSFTTGAADITSPTVLQTIPANGASKVSSNLSIHIVFSEEMDQSTLNNNSSNIRIHDNTANTDYFFNPITTNKNTVTFFPSMSSQGPLLLPYGHYFTVTIGPNVKDLAGNSISTSNNSFSFTVAGASDDSAPVLLQGIAPDSQRGERWSSDGSSRLKLELSASDDKTNSLTVTASSRPLTSSGGWYSYESTRNEGLSPGINTLTFTIKDGATPQQNQVTFNRDIYIFKSWPILISPVDIVSGVSTTPTLQWGYYETDRPFGYVVSVYDGPNPDTARVVWQDYKFDSGAGVYYYSISIPVDKHLAPNTRYYWRVKGENFLSNGITYSPIWSFTTGGTPSPEPRFQRVIVRSDNWPAPTGLRWNLVAWVLGPSPADIVDLKVTGPGGFQYIFTEDDVIQGEPLGLYFFRALSTNLPNGTYTFTVTDSQGKTATEYFEFTNPLTAIPRVNSSKMSPADNLYVNTTTPTFSWEGVGSGDLYRITVMDWNSKTDAVYYSDYTQNTQITVPSGYLLPNTPYKWRVDVFDLPWNNRSASETLRFSTGSKPYSLDLTLGTVWNDNSYYNRNSKSMAANVIGPLPNEVAQIQITGPGFGYDFTQSQVDYDPVINGIIYMYWQAGSPADGTYDFSVRDIHAATDSYSQEQTSTLIPIVEQSSLFPTNKAYLYTLTPTFTWTAVGGSNRYYRVKIMDWMQRYTVYNSPVSTDLYATIPSGVLNPNRSYKWRVEVFDNLDRFEGDNRSTSAWNGFTTISCSGAVTLISPSGTVTTSTPTYTWNPDPSATWYQLVVTDSTGIKIQQWYSAAAVCSAGTCSVTPGIPVALGAVQWKVETYDGNCSLGPWSSSMSFTVACMNTAATLVSPSGTITDNTPIYTWNAVSGAMYYQLLVNDSMGTKIQQWYSAASASCPKGTGTCSVTPDIALAGGAAQWKVQTYGNCGFGPWSTPKDFTVKCLDAPTLIQPSGMVTNNTTPEYKWNAISEAMYYQLVVTDSTGIKIQQWYSAESAGCARGTGTCSVTPSIPVAVGPAQWKVQTYGPCGFDLWSAPKDFTVKCLDAPTPIQPSGRIRDNVTPEYKWNAVSEAMYYQLVVTDSTGIKIQQWYSAAAANCPAGTGTCSVIPTTPVAVGPAQWKVETYGSKCGFDLWSTPKDFTVECLGAPILISPSGAITNNVTPEYKWNAVTDAAWYQLVVTDSTGTKIQQWYSAAAVCTAGTCKVTPTIPVAVGAAQWKVQTYGRCGFDLWSAPSSFTVKCLDAPTLTSPSGTISTSTPTYTWNAVSEAMYYQLVVTDSTGTKIQQWYSAAAANCPSGTGTCSVTPTIPVAVGATQWKVQTYGRCGFDLWSPPSSFTVTCMNEAATLVSPSGTTTDNPTPTYTWNAVLGAMWYQLVVTDSMGTKIQQWYSATSAGCPTGTGTCSVTPATALAVGGVEWKVQTYGNCGFGPWSSTLAFTFKCLDPPTPVSPSETSMDNTPTYMWNAVSGATWYQLVVNDSTGTKIQQWFSASVVCSAGTCSVTPTTALAAGAYQWKIQTYGNCGFGPWSSGMNFSISGASLYDDFSGTYVDKDKWREGELVREIDVGTKRLLLKHASPNPTMITSYPFAESHWLSFPNPNSINSIQADVTILESKITNNAQTRARIAGEWYWAGTSGQQGMIGDIWAAIDIRETPSGVFARWSIDRCSNSDCSTSDYSRYGNFSTPIKLGETYTLYIRYDSANHRFIFEFSGWFIEEQIIFAEESLPGKVADAHSPFKGIGTRLVINDATSSGYIAANFDNVWRNGSTYDDFSSSTINPTNWTSYELVREVSGGKLRSKVRSSSASTSSIYNRLGFLYPSSFDAIQAKVTPLIYQNNQGLDVAARLEGSFYHEGPPGGSYAGEVYAQVRIGGTGADPVASWNVWREDPSGSGNNPESIASGTFAKQILRNNTYTLFLGWDGSQFTFKIDDEEAHYAPTTSIKPPKSPWREICTRIVSPAGKEAIIEALFDDVVVYYSPTDSAATLISPTGTVTNTTPTYTWRAVPEATWYHLYVNDSTGNKIQQWYPADAVGCASGTGNCSVTPNTVLASGAGNWRILTWNPAGLGPWSSPMSFTVPGVGFAIYDDFSETDINKDKWRQGELVREIDGGKLLFKHASPNPVVIASYPNTTWNDLNFSDPNSVNSMQADVTILENIITNSALTRARIGGKWYNDGTAGEGMIGDVWAEVSIRKESGGLYARWEIAKFTNPDGTTSSGIGGGNFTTLISVGTVYKLYIGYNSGQFLFKIDDQEITFGPTGLPPNAGNPKQPSKEMTTRIQINNATSSGYISATFDNVYKNGSTYDDFSSLTISQTNWTTYESVQEISDGKLRSKVRSSSASTSPVNNELSFLYPLSTNYLETKVTLLDYENSQGLLQLAGISGTFYNDGTPGTGMIGDVVAEVYIGGTGVNPVAAWRVYKYTDAGGTSMTELASGTFTTPVTSGSKYTLSLGWDGTRFVFKFDSEVAYYAPITIINQVKNPFKRLRTIFYPEANKKEALIEALFDDVMIYYSPPPSAATQVSPSGGASITPPYKWNAVSTAAEYYLWVNDSAGNKIQKWYTAAEAGCANGIGTCSVNPTTVLSLGAGQWWLQTKNAAGTGPWSSGMSFNVYPISGVTLVSPSGTTASTKPPYTWNAVAEASSYQLWVNDCSGVKILQSYTAAQAGCPFGTGTCSVTPTTDVFGSSQWWIRTYSYAGYGPWSNPLSFSTPSTLPTGQSSWSGTFTSNEGDSGGLYASFTRSGNTVSAQLTVIDPEFGAQTMPVSGTVSGSTFNMSGKTPENIPLNFSGTVSCNVITGTYIVTGEDSGVFTLYKN